MIYSSSLGPTSKIATLHCKNAHWVENYMKFVKATDLSLFTWVLLPPVDLHCFFWNIQCHWIIFPFQNFQFQNMKNSISVLFNLIFVGYIGSKNPVWTGKKIQLVLKSIFISVYHIKKFHIPISIDIPIKTHQFVCIRQN